MLYSKEDRILKHNLHLLKGCGAKKIIREFPQKGWRLCSPNYFLKNLLETGTTDQQPGSGRPRTSRTADNIDAVNDLVLSHEGAPGTHKTTRQTARETGISRRSSGRIILKDLKDSA